MEKLSNIHDTDLSLAAFDRFPIWTWDDAQEGYHPVSGSGDLPVECPTLFFRATFTTTTGRRLVGYIMGRDSFFGFGLFIGGKDYLINFNLTDLATPVLRSLALEIGEDILPLHYITATAGRSTIQGIFQPIAVQ